MNVGQMQRSVETLVEFVQGNTSALNTTFLLDTKLLEILDRLIQKTSIAYVEPSDLIELQGSVSLLLLALLEGNSRTPGRVEDRMLSGLDVKRLAEGAGQLYERSQEEEEGSASCRDQMTEVGFRLYMLVNHLFDYQEQETGLQGTVIHDRSRGADRDSNRAGWVEGWV